MLGLWFLLMFTALVIAVFIYALKAAFIADSPERRRTQATFEEIVKHLKGESD